MSTPPVGIPYIQLTTEDLRDPSLQKFNEQQRQVYLAIQALGKITSTPPPAVPSFADAEVPSGVINGTNKNFALKNTPSPASSLILVLTGTSGKVLVQGVDYTLTGNKIMTKVAPVHGQSLLAWYRFTAS